MYWTVNQMLTHADTYSPAFSKDIYLKIQEGKIPQSEMWKYSSFWYKNFDLMAKKTMIRQLIPTWGPMSIEMQKAYEADINAEQNENTQYVENTTTDNFFEDAETPEEVKQDEVIQPDKSNKTTKSDKNKAVDMHEVEEGLTEEEKAIFGQENFFDEQ
jgi:recombination protein RecT